MCRSASIVVVVIVVIVAMIVIMVMMVVIPIMIMVLVVPVLARFLVAHLVLMFLMLTHFVAEVFFTLMLVKLLTRCVHVVIPTIRHEVDRASAGVVFGAVPGPMSLVTRGHV